MKNENGRSNTGAQRSPEWWRVVPAAEKAVLRDMLSSIRGVKGSQSGAFAQAARKWERRIACFIKFRLMGERPPRRWQRHLQKAERRQTESGNGNHG